MVFFDVKNIAFEAFGYPMSWLELVATAAGLLAVWLSAREHISNWAIGLVNITLSSFVFFQYQLYSDMLLQGYFFATGIYGWWQWTRQDVLSEKIIKVSLLSRPQQIGMSASIVLGTLIFGTMIGKFHEWLPTIFNQPASFPYADTFIMMMSIFGNLLLAIKKIEAWVLWVIVDIIAPVLYFQKGMLLFTFEYLVFLGLAVFALVNWIRIYKNSLTHEG